MSGSRTKALRRAFIAKHGRSPRGPRTEKGPAFDPTFGISKRPWSDVVKVAASRFMRIFPGAKPEMAPHKMTDADKQRGPNEVIEMFTRKIFSVKITEPSEWRRWKKQHRRKQ